MGGEVEEEFLLKWHDHHTSFFLLVEELVTRLVGRSVLVEELVTRLVGPSVLVEELVTRLVGPSVR